MIYGNNDALCCLSGVCHSSHRRHHRSFTNLYKDEYRLRDEYVKLRRERQKIESRDSMDETYRRFRYVRYADDFLIGVIGSKADCVKIKSDITNYMEENLKLELSQEKTLITNAQTPAKFLGFEVSVRKSDAVKRNKNNVPARYYNGKIVLKVAIETVRNKWKNTVPSDTRSKMADKFGLQNSEAIL